MKEINNGLNAKLISRAEKELTLDIDAFEIIGEKEAARWDYKGHRGYMPIARFLGFYQRKYYNRK